jgi:hypothetical protein
MAVKLGFTPKERTTAMERLFDAEKIESRFREVKSIDELTGKIESSTGGRDMVHWKTVVVNINRFDAVNY